MEIEIYLPNTADVLPLGYVVFLRAPLTCFTLTTTSEYVIVSSDIYTVYRYT